MNKSELIDHVAHKTGQPKTVVSATLDALVDAITETVAAGDDVALIGFGTFKATTRAAREGRNPSTGAALKIAEATVPKFTPGSKFKDAVNKSNP